MAEVGFVTGGAFDERRSPRGRNRVRTYEPGDHEAVRSLFVLINRELAPPALRPNFEAYIAHSLQAEIDRTPEYYSERGGAFFVAEDVELQRPVGMYGYEQAGPGEAELRRMYVEEGFAARASEAHAGAC
jgi:putative acetyltransferase